MKTAIIAGALTLLAFLPLAGSACPRTSGSAKAVAQANYSSGDTSETSVDWPGVYQGLLPCADCAGIELTLILRPDHTYSRVTRMLGDKILTDEDSGTFAWAADGSSVMLNDADGAPDLYKVGENRIWQLDEQGQVIEGALAENYILTKVSELHAPPLFGTDWVLVELEGAPVAQPESGRRPSLTLQEGGQVQGFAGCNSLRGKFERDEFLLNFSELISTKMACPELKTEQKFLSALGRTDRFEVVGTSLFLYEGEELLAQLRASVKAP